jgi:hypothetical protein
MVNAFLFAPHKRGVQFIAAVKAGIDTVSATSRTSEPSEMPLGFCRLLY